jgi:DNA-binding MarR family transcriptional regulator
MNKYKLNQWIKYNAKILRGINLLGGKCFNCGNNDVAVLEFHHKDPLTKTKEVSILCRLTSNWQVIQQEILKCELLCCNCHKIKHFNRNLYDKYAEKIQDMAMLAEQPSIVRLSSLEEQLLINLYTSGAYWSDILKTLKRGGTVVSRHINTLILSGKLTKRNKIRRKCTNRIVTKEIKDQVRNLSKKCRLKDIVKLTGVSRSTVYRILKEIAHG